jgi:hypothetical protein
MPFSNTRQTIHGTYTNAGDFTTVVLEFRVDSPNEVGEGFDPFIFSLPDVARTPIGSNPIGSGILVVGTFLGGYTAFMRVIGDGSSTNIYGQSLFLSPLTDTSDPPTFIKVLPDPDPGLHTFLSGSLSFTFRNPSA